MTSAAPQDRYCALSSNNVRCAACRDMKGKASALAEADELWLRTFARRCGVYLALAALTLQVALSFGHFHRHDIAYPSLAHSKIGIVDSQALTKLKLSKQLPSPLADDDADCPICFSTLLLAASFVPDAPQHSPSSDFKDVDRFFDRTFDLVFGSDRTPFQSRAPPLS
jgi:hypothetical protein